MNQYLLPLYKKTAFRFGLGIGLSVAIIGLGLFGFHQYYQNRIYPFISINNVAVGGLSSSNAAQKIKQIYPLSRQITFNGATNLTAKASDLSVALNYSQAVSSALAVGRGGVWQRNIALMANVPRANLSDYLAKQKIDNVKQPVDASYNLNNDNLVITPNQDGSDLNISLIAAGIEKQMVATQPIKVNLFTKKLPALISQQTLIKLQPQAQALLSTRPVVIVNDNQFTPSIQDRFSFISVQIVDGQPVIRPNEDAIKNYVASLDNKIALKAQPDIYFDTGELSQQGNDGLSLDKDKAVAQLEQAFGQHDSSQITLATIVVPKTKKTISRGYATGLYPGKYIEVDLSNQTLYQIDGDNLVGQHRVSTGKWSTPTPVGTFAINDKNPRAYSATYGLYMPYWMSFIGSSYGIHELPEWPNGYKEGEGHIGTPVSHGCIRLGVGDAEEVYNWAEVGTPVIVYK